MIFSDLLTVVGVPAIDPVLKRAQFNQKINSLTQVTVTMVMLVMVMILKPFQQNNDMDCCWWSIVIVGFCSTYAQHDRYNKYDQIINALSRQGQNVRRRVYKCADNCICNQDDSKKYNKRNVSSETRRYAAIRLAASTSSLSQVGGWVGR